MNLVPSYDLQRIRSLAKGSKIYLVRSIAEGIAQTVKSDQKAIEVICNLLPEYFYKTMPSIEDPGYMLDVYHVPYSGEGNMIVIYVKLYEKKGYVKVISFKPK